MPLSGKIFKITAAEVEYMFIGSTFLPLSEYFQQEKADYKQYVNGKCKYRAVFSLLEYESSRITLIHEGVFDSFSDMQDYERETIRITPSAIQHPKKQKERKVIDVITPNIDEDYDGALPPDIVRSVHVDDGHVSFTKYVCAPDCDSDDDEDNETIHINTYKNTVQIGNGKTNSKIQARIIKQ